MAVKQKPVQQKKQTRQKNNTLLFLALISILTFIAFSPSLLNQIDIWDDYYYLNINPYLKNLSIQSVITIFSVPYLANYQPITILSYALEHHFFGFDPLPYHTLNILLHIINSILIFLFIRQLTGKINAAFIASLLFGIHPLHVESVTWVSERKDVLYALFFILAMMSYLQFKIKKIYIYYFVALLLFVCSCMSKAMAVTFPVILILIDYLYDKEFKWKSLFNKIPFFIFSLIFGLIAVKIQKAGGAIGFTSNNVYTLSDRFFFANYSLFFYTYKMFIPIHLSGLYPYPVKDGSPLPFVYLISPLFNGMLFFWIIYSIKRSKNILFGTLFFLFSILPVLQILSVGAAVAADRYFYIASIGWFFLAGIGIDFIIEKNPTYKKLIILSGSVIVLTLSYLTFERTKIWKNSGTFWGNVAEEFPKLELPYYNRAAYYFGIKDFDAALTDFDKAIERNPNYKDAFIWRAELHVQKNNYVAAAYDYLQVIRLDSNLFDANFKLGELYGKQLNDLDKSLFYLRKANQIKPSDVATLDNLGIVYAIKGKYDSALIYFEKALELNPNEPNTLRNIGMMYKNIGQEQKANEYLSRANPKK